MVKFRIKLTHVLKRLLLILILLVALQNVEAQYVLTGQVINQVGRGLAGVTISDDGNTVAASDSNGFFKLEVDSIHPFTFSHIGYHSLTIRPRPGEALVVKLMPDPLLLEAAVVTAFNRITTIQHASVAVSIVNKFQLERYNNASLLPAFNSVAGVRMDERSPGSYRLNIRGNLLRSTFGVRNVKVYWNGIPFSDANGNTYLQQVALSNVDKVEIIKGPAGSMYGAGTGGVVLLSTFPGQVNEKYYSLQSIAGSFGLYAIHGAYRSRNERTGSSLTFSHQASEGYRNQSNLRRDVASYSSVFNVSEKQAANLFISYSDLFYQTPGGLTLSEELKDPKQSRPAAGLLQSAAEQKAALYIKTLFAGLSHTYNFNKNVSNNSSLVVNHTRFRNPAIRNYERKTEQGVSLRSLTSFTKGVFSSTLGGEYQYSFNNTSTFGNRSGVVDTLQYQDEIGSRQFNVFGQAAASLKRLTLTAGLSYNNFHYSFLRVSDPGSHEEASDFKPQYVPRLAIAYTVSDNLNLYASISKGYSPPSVDEVHASDGNFNRNLRAEYAVNYEAGIKAQPVPHKLYAELIVYHFNLRNTIVSRRDASGGDFYVNAGKTRQSGLEVSANYLVVNDADKWLTRINIWVSATIVRALFAEYQQGVNKFDGNKLTGTAPHVFVVGADLDILRFFSNLTYNYTGRIPLNDANTFFAGRYNTLTIKAGYRGNSAQNIVPGFFVSYENNFNKPFSLGNDLNAAGNRFYNPSAPQTFTIGASFRLNVYKEVNKLNGM